MVRIQLDTGYLDVKSGSNFPINMGIGDIRDISKKTGTFSKTLTLDGTKNNHELLNHYYDTNIVSGTFNVNTLTKCTVLQNGIPVIEDAYLQLVNITKTQSTTSQEQDITYEVLVKDASSSFFSTLGGKELTDLDFSDLDHTYSSANVVASFSNNVNDGYKYPVCYNPSNDYLLNEFRPAIYAKTYFDRIFQSNGFTYQWSSLAANRFNKLIIPYNGDKPFINQDQYKVIATATGMTTSPFPFTYTQYLNATNNTISPVLGALTEVQDPSGSFDPLTGTFTNQILLNAPASLIFDIQLTYTTYVNNPTGATMYLQGGDISTRVGAALSINGGGAGYYGTYNAPQGFFLLDGTSYAPGNTNVLVNDTVSIQLVCSNLAIGDTARILRSMTIQPYGGGGIIAGGGMPQFRNAPSGGSIVNAGIGYTISDYKVTITYSSNTIGFGGDVVVNDYVPKKIKQADFIKSIFTMYNLFVDIDKTNTNNLVLKTRDEYYDSGAQKDWTEKLAKDRDQNLQFLPELVNKRMVLTYKQDADEPNKIYKLATNEIYGQVEFIFDNEYIKGVEQKELVFSPTPITETNFGAIVPMFVGSSPKTNIRILYDSGVESCSEFNIYDDYNLLSGQTNLVQYPSITHFDDPLNPDFDINFATCDYYFYQPQVLTANNLYNKYWRRTLNQINTGKMLTAYFDLTEVDIQTLKLNDKIRIFDDWYNINKIIDYNCNVPMLTKVELITVDTEIDLVPFKPNKPIVPVPNTTGVVNVLNGIFSDNNNVISKYSNVKVMGINNVVSGGHEAVIVGNNKIVEGSGVFTDNLKVPSPLYYNIFFWNDTWTITEFQSVLIYEGTTNTSWYLPPLGKTGQQFIIKNVGTAALTIDGDGTETIDGALTLKLNQWDSVTLVDGYLQWYIV
jgi:hypothetical protein